MAFPSTLLGDHVCFDSETFTSGPYTVLTPSSGKRLIITGWDITVTGNTAITPIKIILGSTTHAVTSVAIAPVLANTGQFLPWRIVGISITGGVDEALKLGGGGTAGVISGTIYVTER